VEATVRCWKDKEWYVGTVEGIPGVFSQGKSFNELRENIADAIKLMLEDGGDDSVATYGGRVRNMKSTAIRRLVGRPPFRVMTMSPMRLPSRSRTI
jgi:predicted RNase H-like HicB family nuclease